MLRHLDAELLLLIQNTVPPCDLNSVSAFRQSLQLHTKKAGCCCAERLTSVFLHASSGDGGDCSWFCLQKVADERAQADEKCGPWDLGCLVN